MVIQTSYSFAIQQDIFKALCEEHRQIEDAFDQILLSADTSQKEQVVSNALFRLATTARLESELLFRLLTKEDLEAVEQAQEEHHLMQIMIVELERMSPSQRAYQAKFLVLGNIVRSHFEDLEAFVFPIIEEVEFDRAICARKFVERRSVIANQFDRASAVLRSRSLVA